MILYRAKTIIGTIVYGLSLKGAAGKRPMNINVAKSIEC
jgi:hypothetical protein